jgi:hypothetical protein
MGKLGDMDIGPDSDYRDAPEPTVCTWNRCMEPARFREKVSDIFGDGDFCAAHAGAVRASRFNGTVAPIHAPPSAPCYDRPTPAPAGASPARNALETANDLIYGDRAKAYGPADENHTAIAKLMDAWIELRYDDGEYHDLDAYDSCMFNLMQKISRLAHSLRVDPMNPHRDSLVDGAGYFGVMAKIDDERREKARKMTETWTKPATEAIRAVAQAMDGGGTA